MLQNAPPWLGIGAVAARSGLSVHALRYYERLGLVRPVARTPAGYRQYAQGTLADLALIRSSQELGFSLAEVGALLSQTASGATTLLDVRRAMQDKLARIDAQMLQLRHVKKELARALNALRCDDETPVSLHALRGSARAKSAQAVQGKARAERAPQTSAPTLRRRGT